MTLLTGDFDYSSRVYWVYHICISQKKLLYSGSASPSSLEKTWLGFFRLPLAEQWIQDKAQPLDVAFVLLASYGMHRCSALNSLSNKIVQ